MHNHLVTTGSNGQEKQPLHALQIADALLKIRTVSAVTGLASQTIYRKTSAGEFPQPVRLGRRCTRWRAGDVQNWLKAQAAALAQ